MMKRFFASLACVFLFAAALAGSALASSSQRSIAVGGTYLTGGAGSTAYARINEHGYVVTGGEYINENNYDVSWDGSTLTLKNATIDGSIKQASGISFLNGSFTIELIGDNKVIGVSGTAGGSSPGIGVWNGGLTITGEGSLDVTGGGIEGTYTVNRSHGIYARDNIDINSGTITATGGAVAQGSDFSYPISYGICSWNGSVNISGGHVTANGGTSEDHSYGIFADEDVIVTRGTVTANGGKSNSDSHGIRADSVSVSGGTVNANGGVTTGSSCGIYAGSVEVTGGYIYANDSGSATVTATSGSSYGIYSMGSVTIGDPNTYTGEVNAYGAQATGEGSDSYGIYARGNVVTRGFAKVTAAGGEAGNDSFGISAEGNVEMSGNSTVDASGGSFGISAGSVTWSGYGDITAGGGTAGISAEGDVTMSGYGDVTATGDMAVSDSCGIRSERGNVAISNGTVKAEGGGCGISAGSGDVAISGGAVSATGDRYGIYTAEGKTIIYGGDSITASGGTQAISSCTISPVSGTTGDILGGDNASSAGDVATGADLSAYKYLKITFDVPESAITVGGIELKGSSTASAYATTDADGKVTIGGNEANYNIKWDGVTLTLKDATISGSIDHDDSAVTSIRLVIEGENSITANTTVAYNGISANLTGLTISGDGTLEISASNTGINVYSLTIESGTLKITAGQYGVSARAGVSAKAGVTIKGGEIEISGTGDNFRAFDSYTNVTADPRAGKQICVFVGESEADAEPLGPYTSEFEIYNSYTVKQYFRSRTEDAPIVTGVSISPAGATVEMGGTVQFAAAVSGTGDFSQEVTWSVSGGVSAGTSISANGLLTVAADETAESLTVMATASGDSSKSASATVTVTPPAAVTGVSVSPAGATVEAGKTVQFSATVSGTGEFSQEVTWSVSGGVSAGTSISADGLLTVAADETATSLTVTATASGGSSIYGTATVTVTPPSTPDEPDVPVWPVFPGGSTGPDEPEEPEDEGLPFIDVHEGDWFYENVGYVYENGLMNGVSETLFEPNGTVTRGMIVTILHRLEGEPESDYDMPFTDVAERQWYTEAVRWAAGEGIVTGVSATEFAPDDPITREQFAAILWRYAQSKGYDVSASADLTGFLDYGQISEYALPALQWAVGAGVMSGRGDGILAPQGTATRAEAAAMLMRFAENVK